MQIFALKGPCGQLRSNTYCNLLAEQALNKRTLQHIFFVEIWQVAVYSPIVRFKVPVEATNESSV